MIESHDEFDAEVQLPSKKEICPQCHGEGTHVNPSIDGNGLTYENFDDDPDFYENYFNGHYDVVCHTCNGHNVVDVLDEDSWGRKRSALKRQFYNAGCVSGHPSPYRSISNRTLNCLVWSEVLTLRGLVQMTETELFKLPGIGKKSVEEIRLLLAEGGHRLKEEQR